MSRRSRGSRGRRSCAGRGSPSLRAARSASSRARRGTRRARAAAREAWTWRTSPARVGVARRSRSSQLARDRADAVRRHPDRRPRRFRPPTRAAVDARQERLDVGVAEAPLARWGSRSAPSQPARCVGGREQHDPQPRRDRRLGDRDRHRVRVVVRRPVGLVVDVVELADGAVAGREPSRRRSRAAASCIEPGSSDSASRYMASRQLQKSSPAAAPAGRSPTPRRPR